MSLLQHVFIILKVVSVITILCFPQLVKNIELTTPSPTNSPAFRISRNEELCSTCTSYQMGLAIDRIDPSRFLAAWTVDDLNSDLYFVQGAFFSTVSGELDGDVLTIAYPDYVVHSRYYSPRAIVQMENSDFVISYEGSNAGLVPWPSESMVYGKIYSRLGEVQVEQFRLNYDDGTIWYGREVPSVTALPAGGFVTGWRGRFFLSPGITSTYGVYLAKFYADGSKMNQAGVGFEDKTIIYEADNTHSGPTVIGLKGQNHQFIIVWSCKLGAATDFTWEYNICARRYDSGQNILGPMRTLNSYQIDRQHIFCPGNAVLLSNGNLAVVWNSNGQDGDGMTIVTRIFSISLDPSQPIGDVTDEIIVNTNPVGEQKAPHICSWEDHPYFVVLWVDAQGDIFQIHGQLFHESGSRVGNVFVIDKSDDLYSEGIVKCAEFPKFVVVWLDYGETSVREVFAGEFSASNCNPSEYYDWDSYTRFCDPKNFRFSNQSYEMKTSECSSESLSKHLSGSSSIVISGEQTLSVNLEVVNLFGGITGVTKDDFTYTLKYKIFQETIDENSHVFVEFGDSSLSGDDAYRCSWNSHETLPTQILSQRAEMIEDDCYVVFDITVPYSDVAGCLIEKMVFDDRFEIEFDVRTVLSGELEIEDGSYRPFSFEYTDTEKVLSLNKLHVNVDFQHGVELTNVIVTLLDWEVTPATATAQIGFHYYTAGGTNGGDPDKVTFEFVRDATESYPSQLAYQSNTDYPETFDQDYRIVKWDIVWDVLDCKEVPEQEYSFEFNVTYADVGIIDEPIFVVLSFGLENRCGNYSVEPLYTLNYCGKSDFMTCELDEIPDSVFFGDVLHFSIEVDSLIPISMISVSDLSIECKDGSCGSPFPSGGELIVVDGVPQDYDSGSRFYTTEFEEEFDGVRLNFSVPFTRNDLSYFVPLLYESPEIVVIFELQFVDVQVKRTADVILRKASLRFSFGIAQQGLPLLPSTVFYSVVIIPTVVIISSLVLLCLCVLVSFAGKFVRRSLKRKNCEGYSAMIHDWDVNDESLIINEIERVSLENVEKVSKVDVDNKLIVNCSSGREFQLDTIAVSPTEAVSCEERLIESLKSKSQSKFLSVYAKSYVEGSSNVSISLKSESDYEIDISGNVLSMKNGLVEVKLDEIIQIIVFLNERVLKLVLSGRSTDVFIAAENEKIFEMFKTGVVSLMEAQENC